MTDINRGQWLTHLPINNGHIYSYAMHNYWFTNYRAEQEGTLQFRYSIISGEGLTREQLARFDADTRGPVLAYPFVSSFSAKVGGEDRPLSPASGAFLGLDAPNLQWVTCKAAEDGDGFIVRFREVAGRAGAAELSFPTLLLKEAHLCNGVEANQQKLSTTGNLLRVPYTANQFVTVRIKADSALNRTLGKTARN